MSDWNQAVALWGRKLPTCIQRNEYRGKVTFCIVGSVPVELTEPYRSGFTSGRRSRRWSTEAEIVQALLELGYVEYVPGPKASGRHFRLDEV